MWKGGSRRDFRLRLRLQLGLGLRLRLQLGLHLLCCLQIRIWLTILLRVGLGHESAVYHAWLRLLQQGFVARDLHSELPLRPRRRFRLLRRR
eukprot:COSAG02_NODE_18143_length_957_cov_1.017462_2_plen_91_part_01